MRAAIGRYWTQTRLSRIPHCVWTWTFSIRSDKTNVDTLFVSAGANLRPRCPSHVTPAPICRAIAAAASALTKS
jgi:hypothetical protein